MCSQLCDVALKIGGEVVHAHKVILASISPYFHAMFNGEYNILLTEMLFTSLRAEAD